MKLKADAQTGDWKNQVNNAVLADRCIILDELQINFSKISNSWFGEVVSEHLGYNTICSHMVPLATELGTQSTETGCRTGIYEDTFLVGGVTGDETWYPREKASINQVTPFLITQYTIKILCQHKKSC